MAGLQRILFSGLLFFSVFTIQSQVTDEPDKEKALRYITANKGSIGLNDIQLDNLYISDTYTDRSTGITMVYLQQTFKGIPVFNKMLVLAFKNGKLLSKTGRLEEELEKATARTSSVPVINAETAVQKAFQEQKLPSPHIILQKTSDNGNKFDFGKPDGVTEEVTAELKWFPVLNGKEYFVKLGWQIQVAPVNKDDLWHIRIDAVTGEMIGKVNMTIYDNFNTRQFYKKNLLNKTLTTGKKFFNDKKYNVTSDFLAPARTSLVGNVNYLVIPYPYESPSFTAAAIRTNPWTNAPGNATSLGWHNNGTTDFSITRGNNVWATEDTLGTNQNSGLAATSTTFPDPLNFNFTPNYFAEPTMDPTMQKFCITNLFYWNNITHDITYQYGFDEAAGNYQQSNQGRGGQGNDYVMALAQSGASGHIGNNANFTITADGVKGRMRMYLFSGATDKTLHVNTPAIIAGDYSATESNFSTANKLSNAGPVTGQVVYYNDDAGGNTHYACSPPANSIAGKIALIDRGFGGSICTSTVTFTTKVKNAQDAGAIAVIVADNVSGPLVIMSGSDNSITIPAIFVSQSDGAILAAQLANNLTVTLTYMPPLDGDLDAGVICHEFAHGISNRLTGGPGTVSCLQNAEQGGEGWSDYFGLMQTTDWASAAVTDGAIPRSIGTYLLGEPPNGTGFRNYPYSTNLTVNPLTYADLGVNGSPWFFSNGSEVHNIGEIWCVALWEMTWAIIQQENNINPDFYNFSLSGNGGNSIAFKLVMEGMKLQPCSPGFVDARNAILTADVNLFGGRHQCAIWSAFAKRGLGYSAQQGSSDNVRDQAAAFDLPPSPVITTQPVDTTVNAGDNVNFIVKTPTPVNGVYKFYNWQVSVNGGATWSDIVPAVTGDTLKLNAISASMNGYKYRCVITQGCNATTSSAASLTVVVPSGFTFSNTTSAASSCPAVNSMDIVLGTNAIGGFSNPVTVSAGTLPSGTTVSFIPSETVAPGNDVTIRLTGTSTLSAGSYTITITGMANGASDQTTGIVYTINPGAGPAITSQPSDNTVCAGADAGFSIVSDNATTFQWQVSTNGGTTWNAIAGATSSLYTVTGVTTSLNNYYYRCIATAQCGSTISSAGILSVNSSPQITVHPLSVSSCIGSNSVFNVEANGTGLTYQWQLDNGSGFSDFTDGGAYAGSSSNTLSINSVTTSFNNIQYRCVVSGTCAAPASSTAATLTVNEPVVVTSSPVDVEKCSGTDATFSVSGYSIPVILYQWQVSTNGGISWSGIPGATNAAYTVTGVTGTMNNNQYRCLLSSAICSTPVASGAAIITVRQLPAVGLSASPLTSLLPGQSTTLTATPTSSTGGTVSINWFLNNNPVSVIGNSLPVSVANLGDYQVRIQEKWPGNLTCSGLSQIVKTEAVVSNRLFIFPSPNDGTFSVSFYNSGGNNTQRQILVIDSKGAKVFDKKFPVSGSYTLIPVNLQGAGTGIYYVVVGDLKGNKLAEGKVHIK